MSVFTKLRFFVISAAIVGFGHAANVQALKSAPEDQLGQCNELAYYSEEGARKIDVFNAEISSIKKRVTRLKETGYSGWSGETLSDLQEQYETVYAQATAVLAENKFYNRKYNGLCRGLGIDRFDQILICRDASVLSQEICEGRRDWKVYPD